MASEERERADTLNWAEMRMIR